MASDAASSEDQIQFWILEHACKHAMDEVISEVCQMGPQLCSAKYANEDDVSSIFPALLYLRRWRCAENVVSISRATYFRHAAIIFRHIYCQSEVMSLKFFVVIYVRLAMLAVLRSIEKDKHEVTMSYINDFFPVWSADFKKKAADVYKVRSRHHLDKFRKTMGKCRRYVRLLLTNESMKRAYFEQLFQNDVVRFVGSLSKLFHVFFDALEPQRLPPTVIDGFLRGTRQSKETLSAAQLEFVDRVRQFGACPSQSDLEEMFLDVLSEMPPTSSCLPANSVRLVAEPISMFDSMRTLADTQCALDSSNANDVLAAPPLNTEIAAADSKAETQLLTCRTLPPTNDADSTHWSHSSSLGLSPRSRNRVAYEYEQYVNNPTEPPAVVAAYAATSVVPCADSGAQDIPVVICPFPRSSSAQPTTAEKPSNHRVVGNLNHLPPKKRAFAWPTESDGPLPPKRQRLSVTLNQLKVVKMSGKSYAIFS